MKRPVGVKVLAVFCVAWGVCQAAAVLQDLWRTGVRGTYWRPFVEPVWLATLVWVLMGFLCAIWVVIGVGLWMLRAWARNALVFLMALSLSGIAIHLVIQYILPDYGWTPGYFILGSIALLDSAVIWYMYRPQIKRAFGT
jgi:hypothetical protein